MLKKWLLKTAGVISVAGLMVAAGGFLLSRLQASLCSRFASSDLEEAVRRLEQDVAWLRRELDAVEAPPGLTEFAHVGNVP